MSEMDAFCDKCWKVVEVKRIYFGTNCNVYLECGHHFHFSLNRVDDDGILEKSKTGRST